MSTTGEHCPIDLPDRDADRPYLFMLSRSFDQDGHEHGERINGYNQCPQCGLWWPCIEQPDCWEEDGNRRKAIGWWGAAACGDCGLLMAEQPDGMMECYRL